MGSLKAMNVCLEIYRTVVARAEVGKLTRRIVLPRHFNLAPEEVYWLREVAGVKEIDFEDLREPRFMDK